MQQFFYRWIAIRQSREEKYGVLLKRESTGLSLWAGRFSQSKRHCPVLVALWIWINESLWDSENFHWIWGSHWLKFRVRARRRWSEDFHKAETSCVIRTGQNLSDDDSIYPLIIGENYLRCYKNFLYIKNIFLESPWPQPMSESSELYVGVWLYWSWAANPTTSNLSLYPKCPLYLATKSLRL